MHGRGGGGGEGGRGRTTVRRRGRWWRHQGVYQERRRHLLHAAAAVEGLGVLILAAAAEVEGCLRPAGARLAAEVLLGGAWRVGSVGWVRKAARRRGVESVTLGLGRDCIGPTPGPQYGLE